MGPDTSRFASTAAIRLWNSELVEQFRDVAHLCGKSLARARPGCGSRGKHLAVLFERGSAAGRVDHVDVCARISQTLRCSVWQGRDPLASRRRARRWLRSILARAGRRRCSRARCNMRTVASLTCRKRDVHDASRVHERGELRAGRFVSMLIAREKKRAWKSAGAIASRSLQSAARAKCRCGARAPASRSADKSAAAPRQNACAAEVAEDSVRAKAAGRRCLRALDLRARGFHQLAVMDARGQTASHARQSRHSDI